MRKPDYSGQFKRDVKQAQKRGKNMEGLKVLLRLLIEERPLPENCFDHPLKGEWRSFRDAHIESDWLLIYKNYRRRCKIRTHRATFGFV